MAIATQDWMAFLNAIREDPEDDTSRLVFADFLEENDEPGRAELIRLQCRLARWVSDDEERHHLQRRVRELIDQGGMNWVGGLRTRADGWHWKRGTLVATIAASRFRRSSKLFSPALAQEIRLTGTVDEIADALRSRSLSEFHTLDLSGNRLTDADLEYLFLVRAARHPIAWPKYRLDLRNNQLNQSIGFLLESPYLAALRYLEVDGNPLDATTRTLLYRSRWGAHYRPTPPDESPSTLINSLGMRFVRIPAGHFRMGSPTTESFHESDEWQHPVTLSRDFYLSTTPVTQGQFLTVTGRTPAEFSPETGGSLSHPVERVTWHDAMTFCERLSSHSDELNGVRVYRLPTEAEWEYACRAGTASAYAFSDHLSHSQANYLRFIGRTTPVGSYAPNDWGIFDMHGNVREWCADWYDREYYRACPEIDPPGPEVGSNRVLRGGSWDVVAMNYCRSAYRVYFSPTNQMSGIGFRVAFTA